MKAYILYEGISYFWMVVKRNQKKKGQGKSIQEKKSSNDRKVSVKENKKPMVEGGSSEVKVISEKPKESQKSEAMEIKSVRQEPKKPAEPSKDHSPGVSVTQITRDSNNKDSDGILIDHNKKVHSQTNHAADVKNPRKNEKGKGTKIIQNTSKKKKPKAKSETVTASILPSSSSLCDPHSSFKDQLMVSQEVEDKGQTDNAVCKAIESTDMECLVAAQVTNIPKDCGTEIPIQNPIPHDD